MTPLNVMLQYSPMQGENFQAQQCDSMRRTIASLSLGCEWADTSYLVLVVGNQIEKQLLAFSKIQKKRIDRGCSL